MVKDASFTVFTPTYNRCHTIKRVYDSLCAQTYKKFEWVVVDDGSTDDTEKLIKEWKSTSPFNIIYMKQKNLGKHVAINRGLEQASGDFFIIADSDDSFLPDALQNFASVWQGIDKKDRQSFTGVTGLCVYETGKIVGDQYPSPVFDSNPSETFYRFGVKGEKWGFHRTSVLREFPFPEVKGFNYYPEGLIWSEIGKKYLTRYVNIVVRRYHLDSGNQLTKRKPSDISNMRVFYFQALNDDVDYLMVAPLAFLKIATQGVRFSFHQSEYLKTQYGRLKFRRLKFLWLISLPLGTIFYLLDKARG